MNFQQFNAILFVFQCKRQIITSKFKILKNLYENATSEGRAEFNEMIKAMKDYQKNVDSLQDEITILLDESRRVSDILQLHHPSCKKARNMIIKLGQTTKKIGNELTKLKNQQHELSIMLQNATKQIEGKNEELKLKLSNIKE